LFIIYEVSIIDFICHLTPATWFDDHFVVHAAGDDEPSSDDSEDFFGEPPPIPIPPPPVPNVNPNLQAHVGGQAGFPQNGVLVLNAGMGFQAMGGHVNLLHAEFVQEMIAAFNYLAEQERRELQKKK
jgi:hypothetical protein